MFLIDPYKFGFSPGQMPNLALWLDAADASTITASAGKVSQWADKSGNGRHAAQAAGALQPVTGTRTLNGRNGIDFDSNSLEFDSGFFVSSPYTIIAVVVYDQVSAPKSFLGGTTAAENANIIFGQNPWSNQRLSQVNNDISLSASVVAGTPYITVGGLGASGHFLSQNGAPLTTNANTTPVSGFAGAAIGRGAVSDRWLNGAVYEFIAFNRGLEVAELNLLCSGYLAPKWGLTWAAI